MEERREDEKGREEGERLAEALSRRVREGWTVLRNRRRRGSRTEGGKEGGL